MFAKKNKANLQNEPNVGEASVLHYEKRQTNPF
jgi:hypothetical protein